MRGLAIFSAVAAYLMPLSVALGEETATDADIIPVPEGWVFVDLAPGGFIMEHEDGSRVQVSQCECGGGYRVGMAVEYVRDGRRIRETVFERSEGAAGMTIRVRIWPNGRREVRHVRAPWPEHIRQAFLRLLDPVTRGQPH